MMKGISIPQGMLKQIATMKGLSWYRISKLSGIPYPTIHKLMNSERMPLLSTLTKLAPILDLNPETGEPMNYITPKTMYNLASIEIQKTMDKIARIPEEMVIIQESVDVAKHALEKAIKALDVASKRYDQIYDKK